MDKEYRLIRVHAWVVQNDDGHAVRRLDALVFAHVFMPGGHEQGARSPVGGKVVGKQQGEIADAHSEQIAELDDLRLVNNETLGIGFAVLDVNDELQLVEGDIRAFAAEDGDALDGGETKLSKFSGEGLGDPGFDVFPGL